MESNSQTREPETVPFPEKIIISCVTKNRGPLTKIMKLDPETKDLVKDGTECSMGVGSISQVGISSPAGFAKMLRSRSQNQAIVHGIYPDHKTAKVVTKGKLQSISKNGEPVIARTKDYIIYPDSPGVMLFDHDKARDTSVGSEQALKAYSSAELIELLATIHPEIAHAAYVSTPSTSSCIYDSSGKLLRGEGTGSHIYLFVKKASDIPRYLETLGKRLFLNGLGRIEVSKSGSLLTRTLVDLLVGSPERLDFVAGAECRDGLVQKLPYPIVKNGELLDTEQLQDLSPEEQATHKKISDELAKAAKPTQESVISNYIETEAAKLVGVKISIDEAKNIISSRQKHILEDDDILFFAHVDGGVKVSSVLLDGESFHGKSLADPLEPDYEGGSKTKARFFWNDGHPIIHSFAHGSSKYRFRQFIKEGSSGEEPENDIVAEQAMFDRFVFLASENKIIDTVGHDIKDSMMIERAFVLSQAGQFHSYIDQEGVEKVMPLAKYWLMSDSKKTASSLKYKPGFPLLFENGDGRNYYNTFRFPYQLAKTMQETELNKRLANWHKIMETVFHEHTSYIEDFFSFTIQHPEKRSGIMPVCISDPGLGKSLVMAIISRVVGHQNFSNAKILDVTGLGKSGTQWGDWIFNKKISCIEEIDPEGETGISYKILDALKDIITNETLPLNLKGGRNGTFQIYSNIIGFSNHKNCVKIPYGDRRLFVVDSTGQELLSHTQYKELWEWILDERNIMAVFQYLLNRKISEEFVPGQAKMTSAKKGLQVDGRSAMQQAFDLMIDQYPSDIMTNGEIQMAVSQALAHIEGGDDDFKSVNWNADKQFQAILKTTTTLIAGGKRVRVCRKDSERSQPSVIRAIRNSQDWLGAENSEIRDAMMSIDLPLAWIKEDEDNVVPF